MLSWYIGRVRISNHLAHHTIPGWIVRFTAHSSSSQLTTPRASFDAWGARAQQLSVCKAVFLQHYYISCSKYKGSRPDSISFVE